MVDWKQDSEPILFNGMGTPYLAICNGQGIAIMDKKNNLPIGMLMTNFEYVYDEEDSNHGQFVLQTDNPDLAGLSDLGYYAPLMLQWGWIYPEQGMYRCGPIRKVLVSAKEVIFNENGTQITIEFGDYSYLMKNQPANYYQNPRGFAEYLKMMCAGSFVDIYFADYKQSQINQKVVLTKVESNSELASHAQDDTNQNQNLFLMPGGFNQNDTPQAYLNTKVNIRGYNGTAPEGYNLIAVYEKVRGMGPVDDAYEIKWNKEVEPGTEMITAYLPETVATCNIIVGNQLNRLGQLKEVAWAMKNGPWFVDSVDDKIFVHNQNVNGAVTKIYTYAGGNGELLSFTVKSEFVKKQVQVGTTSDLDDEKNLKTDVNLTTGGEEKVNLKDQVYAFNTGYMQNPYIATTVDENGNNQFIEPKGTFSNEPDNYIEVEEGFDPKDYEADPGLPVFSSTTEAKNKMSESGYNLRLTKEEVITYYKERYADFQEVFKPLTGEADPAELDRRLHHFKSLSQLIVYRKAKIRGVVDSTLFAFSDRCTEEMRNKYTSGEVDLFTAYDTRIADEPMGRARMSDTGITNLEGMGFTVIDNGPELERYKEENPITTKSKWQMEGPGNPYQYTRPYEYPVIVEFEANIGIPIDGIDILCGYPIEWAAEACMPQLEEHTQHSAEATAIVVGDPSIVSSTNMQIQNVSQAYSGIWYIKKVSHRISPGAGYKCEIEFVHRVQDTVTNHTEYSISSQELAASILPYAERARETKSWQNQERFVNHVQNMYEGLDSDQSLVTIVQDSDYQDGNGAVIRAEANIVEGEVSATQIKTNQIYEGNVQDMLDRNGGNTGLNPDEGLNSYTIQFPEEP